MSCNPAARRPHLPQEREHLLSWASPVCTNGVASYQHAKIRLFLVMVTSPKSIIQPQYLFENGTIWPLTFFFLTWDRVPLADSRLRVAISWRRMEPHGIKSLLSTSHSLDNLCCIWMVPFWIFCVPLVSDHALLSEIYRVEMCLCWLGPGSVETITREQPRVDFSVFSEILCDFFFSWWSLSISSSYRQILITTVLLCKVENCQHFLICSCEWEKVF